MEELLTNLVDQSNVPIFTAFLLGILTAISPCPMATNITAIGFISKDISNKNTVLLNGIIYTLGRAIAYTALALLFFFGANQMDFSSFLQQYGDKILGPLLIVIGVFMLGIIKINIRSLSGIFEKYQRKGVHGYIEVLSLGMLFALAFCPYSGVLFFGMLIPITIGSAKGLYLPIIFAIATGLPVLVISWLLAYSISSVNSFYAKMKTFEFWFRKVIAALFIIVGCYYTYYLFI